MMPHGSELPIRPGFVLGIAVAGFFDGIVLHQVLQWHHMICIERHCVATTVASLKRQTFTDGLFHAAMFVVLLAGLAMLTSALANGAPMAPRRFWGALLFGAGVFNVIEGIVDHHILQIHHVRFGPTQTPWDVGFLIVSAVIGVIGWRMARRTASAVHRD
jgi:uncharacterized membrane protein